MQSIPEYFYLPPVRTHWVSELGHFIRMFSLYTQTEHILSRAFGALPFRLFSISDPGPDTNLSTLADLEKRGEVPQNNPSVALNS